jgi:predicted amidohydrolase
MVTTTKFAIAAVQMVASEDKTANLREAERWIREAAARGARVVSLPEVFVWRGPKKQERAAAEPIPGYTSEWLAALAQELNVYLLGGSVLEAIPDAPKAYNTSLLFSPQGTLLASYRKIHLFDVALTEGVSTRESDTRASGDQVVVAETSLCAMGLSICYDLRFPELYRKMATKGAQLIFVPSAFTAYTGKAHWEPLLRSRAIENQVYIVAPAQFGKSLNSFETHGHTMIIDPWGKIVAERPDGAGIVAAEIDLNYLTRVRTELPCLEHLKLV